DQRLAVLEGILGCILILLYTVPYYQKGSSAALHSLAFHQGVRRSCALHLHLSGELFSIFDFSDTPYSSSLFLFCGKRCDRLKALLWEPDGFVLLYKRLDNGRYQWPRNAREVKPLTWEQFTWLMQGLNIEQPRAIRPGRRKELV